MWGRSLKQSGDKMILGLIGVLSPIISKVLDRIPNTQEREKARLEFELKLREQESELLKLFVGLDQGQVEINKAEAAHTSIFVAGWRPFIGWICGVGAAWAFVVKPFFDWTLAVLQYQIVSPTVDTGELMSLLLGMLGMGALRSFEKVKGVASK